MPATKIPKHAKRVFKGVIFDVYHWRQKMFDGGTKTFEIVRRQDTVLVLATVNNKIVVIKQKQPAMDWFYSVPAGRMDEPDETPKQAALRELLEETGLRPKRMKLWQRQRHTGKVVFNVYIYVAQDCTKVAKQQLDWGEKIMVKYVTFEQLLKLASHPKFYSGELQTIFLLARLNKTAKRHLKKAIFS